MIECIFFIVLKLLEIEIKITENFFTKDSSYLNYISINF